MLSTRTLRGKRLAAIAAAGFLVAGISACSSGGSSTPSGGSTGASATGNSPTLVMESSPETTLTQNFNPFATTAPIYAMGADGLIYEPLIQFNLAAPPKYYGYLATGYTWGDGGKSITFPIRQGVKWSDGTPFTPDDVVYTFNLMKSDPKVNIDGLQIASATASGNNVTVTFPSSQYANLENIAGLAIVPKHIWSTAGEAS